MLACHRSRRLPVLCPRLETCPRPARARPQIWLKREELAHTGSHAINNAVGQALLAKRIGKSRVVTETGAGQHGVATASMCARLGLECTIYAGAVDCERQRLSVQKMELLGAKVNTGNVGERQMMGQTKTLSSASCP